MELVGLGALVESFITASKALLPGDMQVFRIGLDLLFMVHLERTMRQCSLEALKSRKKLPKYSDHTILEHRILDHTILHLKVQSQDCTIPASFPCHRYGSRRLCHSGALKMLG